MQRADRTVDGYVQPNVTPITKKDQRASALMYRPVSGDEQIAIEQIFVQFKRLLQMIGSRFFFTVQKEFQIHTERDAFGAKRVDGSQHGDDGGLVIRSRPSVDAPVILVGGALVAAWIWEGNSFAAAFSRI